MHHLVLIQSGQAMPENAKKARWTRSQVLADVPPIEQWPIVRVDLLNEKDKERVIKKIEAIKLYVAGLSLSEIEKRTEVCPSALPIALQRCLELADDGRIMGFRALLLYTNIYGYNRTKDIGFKRGEEHGGMSGALAVTLSLFPDIEKNLVSEILKDAKRLEIPEHKIRPKDLHRVFLKYLRSVGLKDSDWPFCTKYLGVRSIQKYMASVLSHHFERAVRTRENREAIAHLATGTGDEPILQYEQPFDACEFDAYRIDALFSAQFLAPDDTEIDVLLDRIWLLAMIDRVSSAVLAYDVVYSSEVSASDVLKVLRQAVGPGWQPRTLTIPGLAYPLQGGLPNGAIPECLGAQWSVLLLDGALAHLSKAVHDAARKQLGFILNLGPVGHFERRPNIERLFKQISSDIFLRFPSTTGSSPENGRASNAAANAIRYQIRVSETQELLDVTIAQHNATPSEGLFGHSPLEVIRAYLQSERFNFLIRKLPKQPDSSVSPIICKQVRTVRGGRSIGRRPYIQLDRGKYTSRVLATSPGLVGQSIVVEFDDSDDADYRFVRAFLSNGSELGVLTVGGKWAKTKHSRKTRQMISRLLCRRILVWSEFDDPVKAYLRYLGTPTKKRRKGEQPVPNAKNATLAAKVAQEGNLPLEITESANDTNSEFGPSILDESGHLSFGPSKIDIDKIINRQH